MKRMVSILLAMLLCLGILPVRAEETSIQGLAKARIGVTVGSVQSLELPKLLPEAEVVEYNTASDAAMALAAGKIDAFSTEASVYHAMLREGQAIQRLQEPLMVSRYGLLIGKGADLQMLAALNAFLVESRANGLLDKLAEKWLGAEEPEAAPSLEGMTGEKGTILFAMEPSQKPFTYIKNGSYAGFEVELLTLFARAYGYRLEIENASFTGMLTGIEQGRYDLAGSGVTITRERQESMTFSAPYYTEDIVLVVPAQTDGRTLSDFTRATLGVIDGSLYDGISRDLFPEARRDSYPSFNDLFQCVKQGKIDGFLLDIPNLSAVARTDDKLSWIPVPGCTVEIGIAFGKNAKGDQLQAEMNAFLQEIRASGVYDSMWAHWCGDTEPAEAPVLPALSGNDKALKIAVDLSRKPFVYLLNNEYAGFEIELLYRFCAAYGYNPVFESAQWTAGVAGLKSEKYDVVSCGIYMTEERKESVNFCEPYVIADVVMVIYEQDDAGSGLWASIQESFHKTFIREDRWKLIASGLGVTMLISACAVAGGSIFGFAMCLLARSRSRLVSGVTKTVARVYARIIAGTPTLVVLMILFYIVFGKSDISGIWVAILGFVLTFGSFVYGNLTLSVNGVDKGQTEAAYALGYTRSQTFFRIILPQSMKAFLPTYTGEVVGLIKATSVVGYIAVNDLTKMGDIIRSNTYEAMFPLLAVAMIYFLITWGAAALLGLLQRRLDTRKRKDKNILKGVKR